MKIFNHFSTKKYDAGIDIQQHLDSHFLDNAEYVVVWYRRIINKSNRQNSAKLVEVVFNNTYNGFETTANIPLEFIPKMPIGSIWRNGRSNGHYDFNDYATLITENATNLHYSNNYGINKQIEEDDAEEYVLKPEDYKVKGLDKDASTLLVIDQNEHRIIIHPLTFFLAHYGISKEINRILLTYSWSEVADRLNLEYPPMNHDRRVVVIPDRCSYFDAVFLHHLKYDEHTKRVAKEINERVLTDYHRPKSKTKLSPRGFAYLKKIAPYHTGKIEITCKGIELSPNLVLCTQITGMSMPMGEEVHYAFESKPRSNNPFEGSRTLTMKPMFHAINQQTVISEALENAGNSITAVVVQKVITIGEIRKTIRDEDISLDAALERLGDTVIPLDEPVPKTYATGDRIGHDKSIGMIRSLIKSGLITQTNPDFRKLLEYAKNLRTDNRYPQYNNMKIDCYADGQYWGEVSNKVNKIADPDHILSIYVLRLIIHSKTYYILDCQTLSGIRKSGLGISKTDLIADFGSIDQLLVEVFDKYGEVGLRELFKGRFKNVERYNHTQGKNTNWVSTVIDKLRKGLS